MAIEKITASPVSPVSRQQTPVYPVQSAQPPQPKEDMADMVKQVQKGRLQRQVFADPSLARELVKAEASPVYNSKGTLIQSLGIDLL